MNGFRLELHGATERRAFEAVESFIGEDASGSFGILPGHERLVTALVFGLASFRPAGGDWQYLATTGGTLYFADGALRIATRRFLVEPDYAAVSAALERQLATEEAELRRVRDSLHRLEEGMYRRLERLQRPREGGR
ncbi:MAG TPA: F0F1 ATP synthase subunit epsilon [Gammaproteobacteria bacterium]|nr:F0F1 ATP synthase subunit epsilon [Gammaproteobacteria bacterium]